MLSFLLFVAFVSLASILTYTYLLEDRDTTRRWIRPFLAPLLLLYAIAIPGSTPAWLVVALLAYFLADLFLAFASMPPVSMLFQWISLMLLGISCAFGLAPGYELGAGFGLLSVLIAAVAGFLLYICFRPLIFRPGIPAILYLSGCGFLFVMSMTRLLTVGTANAWMCVIGALLMSISCLLRAADTFKQQFRRRYVWQNGLALLALLLFVSGYLAA